MKLGLKLWSTNTFYLKQAEDLYKRGVYHFIELFVVPESIKLLPLWKDLTIPYLIHAPHSSQGLNWAKEDVVRDCKQILNDVWEYSRMLKAKYVVIHPGMEGSIEQTLNNMIEARAFLPELFSNALIENKPKIALEGQKCIGSSPEEIKYILQQTKLGFCFDFGHAICYSASCNLDYRQTIREFLSLKPALFHLSDGDISSEKDQHLHLGRGNYDLSWILSSILHDSWVVIETEKGSSENLEDFVLDVQKLREYVRN